ncbi:hypothetical protein ABTK43_19550, partial [Acinetobacter baumannii]
PQVACLLFEKADKHRALSTADRLNMAKVTLTTAESLRLPRGRHGAWALHEEMLQKAAQQFAELTQVEDAELGEQVEVWTGLARVLR